MPRNRPDRAWLRRHARLLGGVVPADPDLAAAATALMAVLHHGEPLAWDPELEPATGFAVAPLEGRRTPDLPRRPWPDPSPGTLAADIAAAAAGADPQALAHPYRQRVSAWNPTLAAFITPCPPHHPQGQPQAQGPLFGAALAVKDIIQTAELTTTGGSALLADHIPHQDAAVWARLRAAGALCLGKTNTHEFAAGTTNVNDTYGPVRNPHDPSRISGGSSGGSAAAVAVGMAPAALGTDTAGSIRIPAACCGVVGLKPTYGRVSRAGVFPLSWSLDHVGPIAGSVRDVATRRRPADASLWPSASLAVSQPSWSGYGAWGPCWSR